LIIVWYITDEAMIIKTKSNKLFFKKAPKRYNIQDVIYKLKDYYER